MPFEPWANPRPCPLKKYARNRKNLYRGIAGYEVVWPERASLPSMVFPTTTGIIAKSDERKDLLFLPFWGMRNQLDGLEGYFPKALRVKSKKQGNLPMGTLVRSAKEIHVRDSE